MVGSARTRADVAAAVDVRDRAARPASGLDSSSIPFSRPDIGEAEIAAVSAVLRSGWLTSGPNMAAFEAEFAEFVGGQVEAVATNSATAGLHLALEACGIGPGDEVIVPTWTFTATAEVVSYLGAVPVLVDVDPVTLLLDLASVEAALSPRTRAVMPVHFAGAAADLRALARLTAPRGIHIIEDAAHSLPADDHGSMIGSCAHSTAAVFSFYANKTMTTGEGGMVTTRSVDVASRMRTMRLHGIDRDVFGRYSSPLPSWGYDVVAPGFKYNMPDTAAALGRVQLSRAQAMRDRRAVIADYYRRELDALPLTLPWAGLAGDRHAWHLFVIQLTERARLGRDGFIAAMSELGVGCSVHFIPLHRLTAWRDAARGPTPLAAADRCHEAAVSLPLYSAMTDAEVERTVSTVRRVLG